MSQTGGSLAANTHPVRGSRRRSTPGVGSNDAGDAEGPFCPCSFQYCLHRGLKGRDVHLPGGKHVRAMLDAGGYTKQSTPATADCRAPGWWGAENVGAVLTKQYGGPKAGGALAREVQKRANEVLCAIKLAKKLVCTATPAIKPGTEQPKTWFDAVVSSATEGWAPEHFHDSAYRSGGEGRKGKLSPTYLQDHGADCLVPHADLGSQSPLPVPLPKRARQSPAVGSPSDAEPLDSDFCKRVLSTYYPPDTLELSSQFLYNRLCAEAVTVRASTMRSQLPVPLGPVDQDAAAIVATAGAQQCSGIFLSKAGTVALLFGAHGTNAFTPPPGVDITTARKYLRGKITRAHQKLTKGPEPGHADHRPVSSYLASSPDKLTSRCKGNAVYLNRLQAQNRKMRAELELQQNGVLCEQDTAGGRSVVEIYSEIARLNQQAGAA